ncbi:MAG: ATP-binding protein [Rickettsiales bacterium]|nr:ATP-binding protein [Rickettsiales bacterium]
MKRLNSFYVAADHKFVWLRFLVLGCFSLPLFLLLIVPDISPIAAPGQMQLDPKDGADTTIPEFYFLVIRTIYAAISCIPLILMFSVSKREEITTRTSIVSSACFSVMTSSYIIMMVIYNQPILQLIYTAIIFHFLLIFLTSLLVLCIRLFPSNTQLPVITVLSFILTTIMIISYVVVNAAFPLKGAPSWMYWTIPTIGIFAMIMLYQIRRKNRDILANTSMLGFFAYFVSSLYFMLSNKPFDYFFYCSNLLIILFPSVIIYGLLSKLEQQNQSKDHIESTYQLSQHIAKHMILHYIMEIAKEKNDVNTIIESFLEKISNYGRWYIGHIFNMHKHNKTLSTSNIWYTKETPKYEELQKKISLLLEDECLRIADHVVEQQNYIWIGKKELLTTYGPKLYQRGIRTIFAFPIIVDAKIIAVATLYSDKRMALDFETVDFVMNISTYLGMIIEKDLLNEKLVFEIEDKTKELLDERNKAEISSASMKSILANAAEAIITVGADMYIKSFNRSAEKIFGYSQYEATDLNINDLFHNFDPDHNPFIDDQLINTDIAKEAKAIRNDGEMFHVEYSISSITVMGERIYTCFIRDISIKKHFEKELIKAKENAEIATEMKSKFLANMSHEIRTPINGIIASTELLLETPMASLQQEYASITMKSANSLLTIVNDILDLSKIEDGKMTLEEKHIDLLHIAEEVVELIQLKYYIKNIEIILRYAPDAKRYVISDPIRIRQILLNLVDNAVKFTHDGTIVLSIEPIISDDVNFFIAIHDTGIGIPSNKHDEIFSAFDQADNSTTRQFGGTGLGLSICKKLISMLGGEVGVVSEENCGATFWFTLNLAVDSTKPTIREGLVDKFNDLPSTKIDIYAYETNPTVLDIIEEQLHYLNQKIILTSNINDLELDQSPDHMRLVLIGGDIKNPKISKLLQQGDPKTIFIPIIKYHNGVELNYLENLKCNGYLSQASLLSDLLSLFNNIIETLLHDKPIGFIERNIHKTPISPLSDRQLRIKHTEILLVEDNNTNRKLASKIISNCNSTVTEACNGIQALEIFKEKEPGFFDLIFMDCQMPEMDGFQATQAIREYEQEHQHVPCIIIAFTANAMEGDRDLCIRAGMNDYIAKPLRKKTMIACLKKWLEPSPH